MPQISGKVQRNLPSASSDSTQVPFRQGKYGEQYVIPLLIGNAIADEGQYFSAMTQTPGTAYNLTAAAQTAWVATTPTFFLKNNDSAGAKRIFMDFVRFSIVTAGTAGANVHCAIVLDTGARTTSAGTALTVANVNGASGNTSISTGAIAGAITANAAVSPRYLYRGTLKNAALTIGDSFQINFASQDTGGSMSGVCPVGPAILDGGQSLLIYLWLLSQSAAPTGEVQAAWYER
jgi:hypothetical protein